jgi:hypothetical protein
VNAIDHQQAVDAYRRWARNVMQNQLPMLADTDADTENPLVKLAHDSLLLYAGRMQKGLALKGNELPTAVTALGALCQIRKCAPDTNIKENSMDLSDLSNLDRLEKELDEMLLKLKSKNQSDDGDGYDDASDPTADASANSDNVDDEEDDDDEVDKVLKATVNRFVQTNDAPEGRPGKLKTVDHATWRTKMQQIAEGIAASENCSKTEALRRARERNPALSHQNLSKSAPSTYEDLVNAEMKKGCNCETAAQRVAQLHGYRAFDNRVISKGEVASAVLEQAAADLYQSDGSLSRCEALRKARLSNPNLFRKMQR